MARVDLSSLYPVVTDLNDDAGQPAAGCWDPYDMFTACGVPATNFDDLLWNSGEEEEDGVNDTNGRGMSDPPGVALDKRETTPPNGAPSLEAGTGAQYSPRSVGEQQAMDEMGGSPLLERFQDGGQGIGPPRLPMDEEERGRRQRGELDHAPPTAGMGGQVQQQQGNKFDHFYVLTRQIDKGAFSTVWESIHRVTGARYATKIIDRRTISVQEDNAVYTEASILSHLNGPSVGDEIEESQDDHGMIRLVDFFDEQNHFYLVTTFMPGGDVFSRVLARKYYNEDDARKLALNLLESVRYMHGLGVVHRDIKPENLLLASGHYDDTDVRIADFGLAARMPPAKYVKGPDGTTVKSSHLTEKCGTPSYIAPEVLRGTPYDTQADLWSLGVSLYFIMGGYPPFQADPQNKRSLFRKIVKGEFEFHDHDWACVSRTAKNFIRKLLTVDPKKRLTAEQALEHPWIRKLRKERDVEPPQPTPSPEEDEALLKSFSSLHLRDKSSAAVKGTVGSGGSVSGGSVAAGSKKRGSGIFRCLLCVKKKHGNDKEEQQDPNLEERTQRTDDGKSTDCSVTVSITSDELPPNPIQDIGLTRRERAITN